MSEEQVSENQAGAIEPMKSLTLKSNRLAGSQNCLNCTTPLKGPFCYYCGQPDKRLIRFFPVLLREFFEDFLELDSRFTRTMKPLLFHPGRLTRDYLDGRRFRYTPPMRLFIFSSMLFFILAATLASNAVEVGHVRFDDEGDIEVASMEDARELSGMSEEEWARVNEEVERQRARAEDAWEDSRDRSAPDEPDSPSSEDIHIKFNDEEWDRETNPLIIPGMPDSFNDWINDEIEKSPQKAQEIEKNPNLIVDKIFELLPATMFIMLPFVALLFKFWYLFARKYYVEHLIHALHNHAFLFVALTITLLLNALIDWKDPESNGQLWQGLRWAVIAIYIWIPIYLLVSLRTVYRQGWLLTVCKFCVIGISYVVLLTFVTTVVAALSFLLL
jgi:hypothetical protein